MKKSIGIISFLMLSVFVFAQSSDSILIEEEVVQDMTREIRPFNKLIIEGMNIKVILTQGDEYSIIVENSTNEEKLGMEQEGENLIISAKPGFEGEVYLMFKELNYLEVRDIAEVSSANQITTDLFELISSGTTEISLKLDVKSISTKITGASEINLEGIADSHYLQILGAAELNAKDLHTRTVVVDISGAGDADISASEEISGDISGAAKLSFYGDPIVDNIKVSGTAVFKGKGKSEVVAGSGKDTVSVKIGGYNLNITEDKLKEKISKTDKKKEYEPWAGIGFGVNGYLNNSNNLDIPANYNFLELNYAKSIGVELNLFEKDIAIIGEYVQLVTGLGFDVTNYKFLNNTRLFDTRDSISGQIDTVNTYSKTKLTTSFLTIPLLLEINMGADPEKSIHISGGLLFGYNLGSKSKVVYTANNDRKKIKEKGDFNVNPFRYGLTARVGYGEEIALYANYALSTLFKEDKGPELYPFTMGIELLFN